MADPATTGYERASLPPDLDSAARLEWYLGRFEKLKLMLHNLMECDEKEWGCCKKTVGLLCYFLYYPF